MKNTYCFKNTPAHYILLVIADCIYMVLRKKLSMHLQVDFMLEATYFLASCMPILLRR